MSSDLISQLGAVTVKLETSAATLQGLIAKKKNKNKHYKEINTEASLAI